MTMSEIHAILKKPLLEQEEELDKKIFSHSLSLCSGFAFLSDHALLKGILPASLSFL